MNRNWYPPCSPVVAVLSVLDSALARTTVAPATALPLGSVMVPRSDVLAWLQAGTLTNSAIPASHMAASRPCQERGGMADISGRTEECQWLAVIASPFCTGINKP